MPGDRRCLVYCRVMSKSDSNCLFFMLENARLEFYRSASRAIYAMLLPPRRTGMCFLVVFVASVMLVMAQVPLTVAVRPDGTEPAYDLPNRGGEGRQLTTTVEQLPVDSIERFLAEKASGLGHAGVCLLWGPLPQARVAAALDGASVCAQTLLVVEEWELDARCAGAQGVRVPAGQSRGAESGYESVADAGEGWTVGVVCGEGEDLREHLSLHSSGFVDVIVHTAAFAHMLEPLDYKRIASLEQLMAPSGRLVLASPSYLVSVVHDAQQGGGGGARTGILTASRVSLQMVTAALETGGMIVEDMQEAGQGSRLMTGMLMGLGYADMASDTLFASGADGSAPPHCLLSLSRSHSGGQGLQRGGVSVGKGAIRVVVLTQATHSYYSFVKGLAASLDEHLASVPISGGTRAGGAGGGDEFLDVTLVVFSDNTDPDAWREASTGLRRLRVQHRFVPHYGWPALALRRWQTYLEAEPTIREADVAFHIDTDARVVASLLPLVLSASSFGVVHADNAYYDGHEVVSFDPGSWHPLRTRDLPGFLGAPRDLPRGYFDQACLPQFCRQAPPYETRVSQRCGMDADEGSYYFYSGFFGGSGAWMMRTLITLQQWTAEDWARGYACVHVCGYACVDRRM